MDDIVRKDIPPETPNDRLTTPHLPARDPKDQVEQPDTRGRALTHAQHQSHGGQPNSPRHHQQIGASRLRDEGGHDRRGIAPGGCADGADWFVERSARKPLHEFR